MNIFIENTELIRSIKSIINVMLFFSLFEESLKKLYKNMRIPMRNTVKKLITTKLYRKYREILVHDTNYIKDDLEFLHSTEIGYSSILTDRNVEKMHKIQAYLS